MPRAPRVTMFFTDGNSGWSETHYDLTAQTLNEAISRFRAFLYGARQQLLASGPYLQYVRASFDDTWRDSQVFYLAAPTRSGGTRQAQFTNNQAWKLYEAAVPWTSALLRGVSGDLYRKQIYISGIPYPDPTDISQPVEDPVLVQAFLQYQSALVGKNYGFPVWKRELQGFPFFPVTSVVANPGVDGGSLVTAPGLGVTIPMASNTRLWFHNMKFLPNNPSRLRYNGPYVATSMPAPGQFVIPQMPSPPIGFRFLGGKVQAQTKDVVPYTELILERFTHRKRGRPFDSPRGRLRRAVGY